MTFNFRDSSTNVNGAIPKHVTIPQLSGSNELIYEGQLLMIFLICLISQYLNLYRTVWWLNQSNFYTVVVSHFKYH